MQVDRRCFLVNSLFAVACGSPVVRAALRSTPNLAVLRNHLSGRLLTPHDAGYATARLVYNTRFDAVHPLAVAQCRTAADVQACVNWARTEGVRVTARSGGHSYGGYSTSEGLVVDVSALNGMHIDALGATATIGAGARLIDVYAGLASHGATIPAGSCPSVGLGGLALGGGYGLAGRAFGTSSDNLVSARIVTADGRLLTCNASHHPDLFWALRGGGGGNFGVVCDLTFRLHRVNRAAYYFIDYAWADAASVIEGWHHVAAGMTPRLGSILSVTTGASAPVVRVFGQYIGSEQGLSGVLAPLRAIAAPTSVTIGSEAYFDLMLRWAGCLGLTERACHTAGQTPGGTLSRATFGAKSDYITHAMPHAGAALVKTLIEQRQAHPDQGSGALLFDAYGGVVNHVAPDATAFVHRTARSSLQYLAYWGSPAHAAPSQSWLGHAHRTLAPYTSGGAYQNYIDPDLAGWRSAYYGANYPRLRHVKAAYDPHRLFRFRQAID